VNHNCGFLIVVVFLSVFVEFPGMAKGSVSIIPNGKLEGPKRDVLT
jgi:hypothetical protein